MMNWRRPVIAGVAGLGSDRDAAPPTPLRLMRVPLSIGMVIVVVFLGGLAVWAALAPLDQAAIAPGLVQVENAHKTIAHLEGGIIKQIYVKDGDAVSEGQLLIRLDDTKARTTFRAVEGQIWDGYAGQARLIAERDGRDHIEFPDRLLARAAAEPEVAKVIAGQQKIFDTRRQLMQSKIDLINQKVRETSEEIAGLQAQLAATDQKLRLITEELDDLATLVGKGLARKPQLLQLRREEANIEGTRGDLVARIARAQQSIVEAQLSIVTEQSVMANEVAQQLRETQQKLHELEQQRQATEDTLSRIEVRAPESGLVTALKVHTPGGVIAAGEALLDIVPVADRLVVDAKVRPEDIDMVHVGLAAAVRLLPYKQRRTPPVDGMVSVVSADRLVDKESSQAYYLAKIEIAKESLDAVPEVKLLPGMAAEVMIRTGRTTVALYALAPLLDSFHRAFKEK
jgi:HlyD family secretion protein